MDDSQLETKLKKSLQNYSNIFFQQQRQKDHPNSFTNNQNSTLKDIQNETKRKKKKRERERLNTVTQVRNLRNLSFLKCGTKR